MSKSTSTEEQMKRMNILRQLPDTALFAIYAEMFGEQCLNKKLVIKRILQRGDVHGRANLLRKFAEFDRVPFHVF